MEKVYSKEKTDRVNAQRSIVDLNKKVTMLDFDLQETRSSNEKLKSQNKKLDTEVCG